MPDANAEAAMSPEQKIARIERLAERRTTPCGDGEMVWRVWGDGPPLVLFHGGYGSWIHWIRNVVPLGERYTVFAPDLPGLGDSAPPPDPRSARNIGEVVAEGLRRVLPDGPFDLVGFSFGAVIGGQAATHLGERVRTFTLVGAGGLGLKRGDIQELLPWRREMSPDKLTELHRRNLEILMLADPVNVDDVALWMQMRNTMRAVVKSRYISRGTALRDVLPDVKARLAGIWGEYDATTRPHMAGREALLREFQPDLDFRVIPGAGHWVMYEAADAFNATLLEMLARAGKSGDAA